MGSQGEVTEVQPVGQVRKTEARNSAAAKPVGVVASANAPAQTMPVATVAASNWPGLLATRKHHQGQQRPQAALQRQMSLANAIGRRGLVLRCKPLLAQGSRCATKEQAMIGRCL